MARPTVSNRGRALLQSAVVCVGLGSFPPAASAQRTASDTFELAGVVRSAETGAKVAGARVTTLGAIGAPAIAPDGIVVTSEGGEFRFRALPAGHVTILVRRLGFRPETVGVNLPVTSAAALVISLRLQVPVLASVVVRAASRERAGELGGYDRRRKRGFGHYITREQIEHRRASRTTDLLRAVPGITLGRGESGTTLVRFRGNNCGDPHVWLDGTPLGSSLFFDLDAIPPSSIEAIELYNGLASLPAEIRGTRGSGRCGAIVVWTRQGELRPKKNVTTVSASDLAGSVDRGTLYTAEQTDKPATLERDIMEAVEYPEILRERRAAGQVMLEFVVDEQGYVEAETINIVATSDAVLADAVRTGLPRLRFVPAVRAGAPVRQVVLLPIQFTVAGGRTSAGPITP